MTKEEFGRVIGGLAKPKKRVEVSGLIQPAFPK